MTRMFDYLTVPVLVTATCFASGCQSPGRTNHAQPRLANPPAAVDSNHIATPAPSSNASLENVEREMAAPSTASQYDPMPNASQEPGQFSIPQEEQPVAPPEDVVPLPDDLEEPPVREAAVDRGFVAQISHEVPTERQLRPIGTGIYNNYRQPTNLKPYPLQPRIMQLHVPQPKPLPKEPMLSTPVSDSAYQSVDLPTYPTLPTPVVTTKPVEKHKPVPQVQPVPEIKSSEITQPSLVEGKVVEDVSASPFKQYVELGLPEFSFADSGESLVQGTDRMYVVQDVANTTVITNAKESTVTKLPTWSSLSSTDKSEAASQPVVKTTTWSRLTKRILGR